MSTPPRKSYNECIKMLEQAEFALMVFKQDQRPLLEAAQEYEEFCVGYYKILHTMNVLHELVVIDDQNEIKEGE